MSEEFDYKSIPLRQEKSPEDPRDWHISRLIPQEQIVTTFPDEFELPYNHPIKNQGNVGSCVSHSLTYCREIGEEQQTGKYTQLSVGFVYANRKTTDYQGSGMYPNQALQCLVDYGICDNASFPINKEFPDILNDFNPIKDELITNASPRKITAYGRCYTVNDIKNSLITLKNPVSVEIPIWSSFYGLNSQNSIIPIPDDTKETLAGFHEVTITGWRKSDGAFHVLNSWGNWGENGYFWMLPSFLPYVVLMYSMTDNIIEPPKPEPKKTYTLTISSDKTSYNTGELILVKIKTSETAQQVSCVFNRPSNSQPFNPTITTDNVDGSFTMPFVETVDGQFKGTVTWKDPNSDTQTATINLIIVKPVTHNYQLTTDKTTLTSPINTPLNINVKLTDNGIGVTNQPIQLIYTGVSSGGGASNTDNLGVASFTLNSDKIGVNNLNFIWFDAPTGKKYTLAITVNWIDKVDPNPTKKLWHVQTLPINSLKTAEIQAQQTKLKELGYSVYSTISNQIVANSTEELAKVNSDKLTTNGIANIVLYY